MIETFVRQLGQELEMNDIITEPDPGHFQLPFEDNMDVEITLSPQGHYYFKSTIAPIPQTNVESFFQKAMDANLYGRGTRGAVIGLNDTGEILILSMELDQITMYKDWRDKLQDFVTILNFWRDEANNWTLNPQ